MAIENERKLMLRLDQAEQILHSLAQHQLIYQIKFFDIQQHYLCDRARVRRSISTCSAGFVMGQAQHHFAYKVRSGDGHLIEIETEITEHDHDQLITTSQGGLHKTRAKFSCGMITWDVDFFKDSNHHIMMVMAEAEMPSDQTSLPTIHTLLAPYASFWVAKDDRSFDNKNLTNPVITRQLLLERSSLANVARDML